MKRLSLRFAALAAVFAFGSGCASETVSRVDQNWGTSVHDNFDMQISNPDAPAEGVDPGRVSDGKTSELAMQRFRRKQAPQQSTGAGPVFNIGMISP